MYSGCKDVIEMNRSCSNDNINTDNETIINNQIESLVRSRRTDRICFQIQRNSRNNNIV